jgi:hypothetical protein
MSTFLCIFISRRCILKYIIMKEEFLHYVWKYGFYHSDKLKDRDGNLIEVLHPGEYNHDSGPDFFNARIRISGTEWAGNVEIHTKASHFELHGHHRDHAFDNVILHVTAENDRVVRNARGKEVLTVEIEYDSSIFDKYTALVNNPVIIACQGEVEKIDRFIIRHWLHSLLIERLTGKSELVSKILSETGGDWEETFYRVISRYFGFRINTEPFEMLASALPFKIIKKHIDNRFQVESLLFGTAGLLDEGLFKNAIEDQYYRDLLREYKILSAKYSLKPVHGWLWKFSRLRPVNFPTVRISQLASMLSATEGFFSQVTESMDIKKLKSYFEVSASDYWDEHYLFGKKSRFQKKRTGVTATDILLINAVIPVLFSYGLYRSDNEITERSLSFLDKILPEDNLVIREWGEAGINPISAFDTQALLQLRNEYCRKRRCLECRIGTKLIGRGASLKDPHELILEP